MDATDLYHEQPKCFTLFKRNTKMLVKGKSKAILKYNPECLKIKNESCRQIKHDIGDTE